MFCCLFSFVAPSKLYLAAARINPPTLFFLISNNLSEAICLDNEPMLLSNVFRMELLSC